MTSKVSKMPSKVSKMPGKVEKVKKLTKKRKVATAMKATDYDSDSDANSQIEEKDNARLSDDEEFPISDDDGETTAEPVTDDTISGWATAMTKVLKTKGSLTDNRSLILSKATKVEQIEKKKVEAKKSYNFEVAGEEDKKGSDDTKPGEEDLKTEAKKLLLAEKTKQRDYFKSLRMKPTISDLDRERALKKIATKGCVQLFNAVRSQQKDLNQQLESTKLEYKKDEIIKGLDKKRFLGTLMGGQRSKSELVDNPVKVEDNDIKSENSSDEDDTTKKKGWGALRTDFMTGKKTGWDQRSDDSDEGQGSEDDEDSD